MSPRQFFSLLVAEFRRGAEDFRAEMPTQDSPGTRRVVLSLPWQTVVGAQRLAAQLGLTPDAYVQHLLDADIALDAVEIRQRLERGVR